MLDIIVGAIIAILSGIVGWIFQRALALGAKVAINETKLVVIETRHDDLITLFQSQFTGMNLRLDRIERAMNGFLKHYDK